MLIFYEIFILTSFKYAELCILNADASLIIQSSIACFFTNETSLAVAEIWIYGK